MEEQFSHSGSETIVSRERGEDQSRIDEIIQALNERFGEKNLEERRAAQREILQRTSCVRIREAVEEAIERQEEWLREHNEAPLSESAKAGYVRGNVFEQLAIASIPEEERPYPELEEFILGALKDPRLWLVAFEGDLNTSLTEEERKLALKYLEVKPSQDELRAMRNNDAIAVEIVESERGPVALITGVKEAKTYRLYSGQTAEQAAQAPERLVTTVNRFKEVFPLLVRYLGLSGELPEQIGIVSVEDLNYTFIQPSNVRPPSDKVRQKMFPHCNFERIPFSQKESAFIANLIVPEVGSET